MRVRSFAGSLLIGLLVFAAASCRREKPVPPVSAPPAAPEVAVPHAQPADPQATAAVGKLHEAERAWLEKSPEAAAAFRQLKDAQAAYQAQVEKFGLYTTPVRERESRMAALHAAQAAGEAAAIRQAEKEWMAAADKVEEAEAMLRSGNPSLQALYDKWVEARKTYADLRSAEPAISQAADAVSQALEKGADLDDGTSGAKEN